MNWRLRLHKLRGHTLVGRYGMATACGTCLGLPNPENGLPAGMCERCGSRRLRLEVPPDFEEFEVCRDCRRIQTRRSDV